MSLRKAFLSPDDLFNRISRYSCALYNRSRHCWQGTGEWSVTQMTCQLPGCWFLVTPWFPRCPGWRLKMPEQWLQSHLWDYRSQPLSFFLSFSPSLSLSLSKPKSFILPSHDQGHWVSALEIPPGAQKWLAVDGADSTKWPFLLWRYPNTKLINFWEQMIYLESRWCLFKQK